MKFTKMNKEYVSPEISVIAFEMRDIITASGNDGDDNWSNDPFNIGI